VIAHYFHLIKPYLGQLLLGASIGFIAGYTFKKAARSLAVLIIGLGAIFIILLNYTDLINIDLINIKSIGMKAKDMALEHKQTVLDRTKGFVLTNLSFLSGVVLGFLSGIRIASKK